MARATLDANGTRLGAVDAVTPDVVKAQVQSGIGYGPSMPFEQRRV